MILEHYPAHVKDFIFAVLYTGRVQGIDQGVEEVEDNGAAGGHRGGA
jgi:hypothetical protein